MAYDQHYRTGPAARLPQSIGWKMWSNTLSTRFRQAKLCWESNYGYDWPQAGIASARTYDQTMQLAAQLKGTNIKWHNEHKVPYFTYGSNRQVWFENRYSIKYKLELVNQYKLHGIALWRLGQEDRVFGMINTTFK